MLTSCEWNNAATVIRIMIDMRLISRISCILQFTIVCVLNFPFPFLSQTTWLVVILQLLILQSKTLSNNGIPNGISLFQPNMPPHSYWRVNHIEPSEPVILSVFQIIWWAVIRHFYCLIWDEIPGTFHLPQIFGTAIPLWERCGKLSYLTW